MMATSSALTELVDKQFDYAHLLIVVDESDSGDVHHSSIEAHPLWN